MFSLPAGERLATDPLACRSKDRAAAARCTIVSDLVTTTEQVWLPDRYRDLARKGRSSILDLLILAKTFRW